MYITSKTVLTNEQVEAAAKKFGMNAWTKPGTNEVRNYLNKSSLEQIIGLEESYYRSGNVSGCSYIDYNGERVDVAHCRAYLPKYHKIFIVNGKVNSSWGPFEDNMAELIAQSIIKNLAN